MVYNLPTTIAPGDAGHATRHNEAGSAVNDLDTRATKLEERRVFLPAPSFQVVSGSPTLNAALPFTVPVWLLDEAATEIVSATFQGPRGWSTATAYLWWSRVGSTAGDIRWQFRYLPAKASGDIINTGEVTVGAFVTAGGTTQGVITRTSMGAMTLSADPTNDNRPLLAMSVRRLGADAQDTMVGDAALVGVELVKAS